jgi:hypothetical protein
MMMMKKIIWGVLLVTGLLLAACQSKSTKITPNISSTTTTTSARISQENSSSTVSSKAVVSQTTTTREGAASLWNAEKAQQLNSFMQTWGTTMGQIYKEYTPGNNVSLYGLPLPDGILNGTSGWQAVIDGTPIELYWSESGRGTSGYALVSVYSDAESQPYLVQHVYFFTLSNGQPTVLVTSQNQGNEQNYLYFKETENTALKAGFAEIVRNG